MKYFADGVLNIMQAVIAYMSITILYDLSMAATEKVKAESTQHTLIGHDKLHVLQLTLFHTVRAQQDRHKLVKDLIQRLIRHYFSVGEKKSFVFEEKSVPLKSETTQQQYNR